MELNKILDQKIAKAKDDLQHAEMVEHDKAVAAFCQDELSFLEQVKTALEENQQYKSIEQELGVSLIHFFSQVWLSDRDDKGVNHPFPINSLESLKKNHGKTWALTKEELEHGK